MISKVTDSVILITEEDTNLDLFESRYPIPEGVTYNSYVIMDRSIAVTDTMDARKSEEWFSDLRKVLDGKEPDYLIVHHMEPDHAANVKRFLETYPNAKVVGNEKTFKMMLQFFDMDIEGRKVSVSDGSELDLGEHKLKFVTTPLVHWPEVMMSYDAKDRILFTADAFGRFGPADGSFDWETGARRYYYNIVGKYGAQASNALKKVGGFDIAMLCPLHGPVLKEDLGKYLGLYGKWTTYQWEVDGVFIAYNSVYGNTRDAALLLAEELKAKGRVVEVMDVARNHVSYAISNAFMYRDLVLAATTYDGEIFPEMFLFLTELKDKKYGNRRVGVIDNGTWGPMAGKKMAEILAAMEGITVMEPKVSIKSSMKDEQRSQIKELAANLS